MVMADKNKARQERKQLGVEYANIRKMKEWLLPLLESNLINKSLKDAIILSVGCGIGADVDELVNSGINAYGVEPFSRTKEWQLRKNKGHLIKADGENLPFNDEFFNVIYCSEVMEHVGFGEMENIEIDSIVCNEREKFARELTRTLKFGGTIILSTPNRYFFADIGHSSNFLGVRIHSPLNDFTLSFADMKTLFVQKCGCRDITTLPYDKFISWDYYAITYPTIRPIISLLRTYLRLLDRLKFLKTSFFSPHLILAIKK
jgi:SAM-dependent methyltransferase